jgi:hypothetical protein
MSATTITRTVLRLLVTEDRPWMLGELIRATSDRLGTVQALAELHAAGLANWLTDDCICASRAALVANELDREPGGDA